MEVTDHLFIFWFQFAILKEVFIFVIGNDEEFIFGIDCRDNKEEDFMCSKKDLLKG